jgi:hypothetical protein
MGCKQAYVPPVHSANNSFLVVEGFINNGQDSTYIYLTHTFSLADTGNVTPELHAKLTVEGKDNSSYPLQEWGNGQYGTTSLALNNSLQYRLHIKTSTGKEYLSDFLDLKTSPPIDSISWKRTGDGVQIYANTHDPQNASHYYRWEYQEAWEFHSVYFAYLQWVNMKIEPLNPNPFYTCYKYAISTSVLINSTTKLAKDEVYLFPLELIPPNSWMISVRYSMLVKQYVLTPDAYNYWQDLQKNTEQIGSIFSPQPFALTGNIHAVADTSEPVIGYLSAGTLQKVRIWITPDKIPNWQLGYYADCDLLNIPSDSLYFYLEVQKASVPVSEEVISPTVSRWNIAAPACVDCTLTGTLTPPPFW